MQLTTKTACHTTLNSIIWFANFVKQIVAVRNEATLVVVTCQWTAD